MSTLTKIPIAEHDAHDLELLHYELEKSGIQYISEAVVYENDFRDFFDDFDLKSIL